MGVIQDVRVSTEMEVPSSTAFPSKLLELILDISISMSAQSSVKPSSPTLKPIGGDSTT